MCAAASLTILVDVVRYMRIFSHGPRKVRWICHFHSLSHPNLSLFSQRIPSSKAARFIAFVSVAVFLTLALSRIASLTVHYRAPIEVYTQLSLVGYHYGLQ
jgi:hypothetical protein